jgi:hypothetical protein
MTVILKMPGSEERRMLDYARLRALEVPCDVARHHR